MTAQKDIEKSISVSTDVLLPFQIEKSVLRGRLVRLDDTINTIIQQHQAPASVARLIGEAAALAAALGSALKFDGIFTLQAKGSGPISMIVADVTSEGAVRAYARWSQEELAKIEEGASLIGEGTLVFTVDQKISDERYQGVVKLEGDSLVEAFQAYFRQSEQIPTGLFVGACQDGQEVWHAGCLMLQQMPREGGHETNDDSSKENDWLRAMHLMQTCTVEELTDASLSPEDLLFRLFHEDGVRVYDKKGFYHKCRCSAEKIKGVLSGMPDAEIEELAKDNKIDITCQFCSKDYSFTPKEIKE